MSIKPLDIIPPNPGTHRAQTLHLSYDRVNNRVVYPNGKSVIIRLLERDLLDSEAETDVITDQAMPRQFTGHIYPTTVATFSPNGNYVASGDDRGNLKIWDALVTDQSDPFQQPIIKSEFQVLAGPIKSIAWDADGQRIIAVGQGKEKFGHCFSWDSGNSIGEIQGHSATINAVAIRPIRPYRAATVSDDKAMVFFNGPPFKFDKSVRGHHTNAIRDIKFSPDGLFLVSVSSDRAIVLYDGKTGEFIHKIDAAHNGSIFAVAWFPDSKSFVTASADGSLKVWNSADFKSSHAYIIDASGDLAHQQVGLVVTNDQIISLSFNGELNLFKYESSTPDKIVPGHTSLLTAMEFVDEALTTGGSNGQLFKWPVNKNNMKRTPIDVGSESSRHQNYVAAIASDYTCGWDDILKKWAKNDVVATTELSAQPKVLLKAGDKVIVLLENKIVAYTSSLGSLSALDLTYSANSASLIGTTLYVSDATSNTVHRYLISENISEDTTVSFPTLRAQPCVIRASPDGKLVAVADTAGKYVVYNASNAEVVTTRWAFHTSRVSDAKWSPDSKFLVSVGLDSGIFLYSTEKPSKVLKSPLAHQNGITGVEWILYEPSTKSGSIASVGLDGSIKTWAIDMSVF